MSAHRADSPDLHAQFAAICPEAPLPWNALPDRPWVLVDAIGFIVAKLPTPEIAAMILVAVNTCGGFRAELVTDSASPRPPISTEE